MSHRLIAALAAACLPCVSMAANLTFNSVSAQCSDQLSVLATPGLSWRCTGDLALNSVGSGVASLSNSVSINLYASGNLTLNNVSLNAPFVSLEALGLTLGLHSPINAPDVVLISPGSPNVPGGTNTVRPVMDPNVLAQLLPVLPPFQLSPRAIVDWSPFDIGSASTISVSGVGGGLTLTHVIQGQAPLAFGGTLQLRDGGQLILDNHASLFVQNAPEVWPLPTVSSVPEPSIVGLVGMGLLTVVVRRRRQSR